MPHPRLASGFGIAAVNAVARVYGVPMVRLLDQAPNDDTLLLPYGDVAEGLTVSLGGLLKNLHFQILLGNHLLLTSVLLLKRL